MKINRNHNFVVFSLIMVILFLFITGTAFSIETETVIEEGCAPVYKNLALTRDEALRAAQRAAVEKVIGGRIIADTKVQNFQVSYNKVILNSAGYIRKSEILDGSEYYKDEDLYCIKVRSEVVTSAVISDIVRDTKTLCFIQENYHKPRVMVIFEEKMFGKDVEMPISEIEAARYLENICMNIIDKKQFEEVNNNDLIRVLAYGDSDLENINDEDVKKILTVLLNAGTEWILKGYAAVDEDSCSEQVIYGSKITSCQASVRLKMINTQSGRIYAPVVINQNAAQPNGNKKSVANDAIINATRAAMEEAIVRIVENWKTGQGGEGTCTEIVVSISGASSKEFEIIRNYIEGLAELEICSVEIVNFSSGGISKLSVSAKFTGQELFGYLMDNGIDGIEYEIMRSSQNSLDIKIIK